MIIDNPTHEKELFSKFISNSSKLSSSGMVIVCSGSLIDDNELLKSFAQDINFLKSLKIDVCIVHGSSQKTDELLANYSKNASSRATAGILEMIQTGVIGKKIASSISNDEISALSISGKDCDFIRAKRLLKTRNRPSTNIEEIVDFGLTGEVESISPDILYDLDAAGILPIISPIAKGESGESFQIDPDLLGCHIGSIMSYDRLILIDDFSPIKNFDGSNIHEISNSNAETLLNSKKLTEDSNKKISKCLQAINNLIDYCYIIDGRTPHSLAMHFLGLHDYGTTIFFEQ